MLSDRKYVRFLLRVAKATRDRNMKDELWQVKLPTLIIWGEHDKSYAWSQIEQLWRTIPGASLAVVPGCAHAVHLEKPGLFNLLLADFLEGR